MSTRTLIRLITGMAFALALLPACGDVNGGDIRGGDVKINRANWPWASKADFVVDKTISEEVRVEDHIRIRLDAVNGQIAITGRPEAGSVRVSAKLRVGSNESKEDAKEKLDQLDVRVADRSDEILVQTLQPKDSQGRQYVVNYTITVPSDLEIAVHQINGDVTVEDSESSIFVDVVNGHIDTMAMLPSHGEISLSTGNGDLDLRIPTSTSAKLSAFVDSGTITWDNLEFLDAVSTRRSLKGTLGDGAGRIDLESMNGNIDVSGLDG